MAKRDISGPVTLSVLDRLIDKDPKVSMEVPLTRAQSLRELKIAIKRDLEWLLNTRRTIDPAPDSAHETGAAQYPANHRPSTRLGARDGALGLPLRLRGHILQVAAF